MKTVAQVLGSLGAEQDEHARENEKPQNPLD